MKRIAFALTALTVSVTISSVSGAQESGMPALEALGRALRGGTAWQADYAQEYIAAGMGAGDEQNGQVVVIALEVETGDDPKFTTLPVSGVN